MNDSTAQTIGLIGLGNAGAALAIPLARQYAVVGYDINPERINIVKEQGVQCLGSVAAVAEAVDIILLNLPKPDISVGVTKEVLAVDKLPKMLIETSTVTPATAKQLDELCRAQGVA